MTPAGLGRHPRLQRGRRHRPVPRPAGRGDHAAVRGPRRLRLARRHDRGRTSRSTRETDPRLVPTLNTYGRGPARALRYGIEHATRRVVVVTMADGCDDPTQIDAARAARRARRGRRRGESRYMHGGQQVGGPVPEVAVLAAGRALAVLVRPGRHPRRDQLVQGLRPAVRAARSASSPTPGSSSGIELVAKARRRRLPVAEIPTIWLDRAAGHVELQGGGLAPALPPLVLLRIRHARHRA